MSCVLRLGSTPLIRRILALIAGLSLVFSVAASEADSSGGDVIPRLPDTYPGDPIKGRLIVIDRQQGFCLLCHSGKFSVSPQQGNLAPSLDGAGNRWSPEQLRARLIDSKKLNPHSIMPAYGLVNPAPMIAQRYLNQAILTPQQIEDVVAFLSTLKD